jgi:hypothetical protein
MKDFYDVPLSEKPQERRGYIGTDGTIVIEPRFEEAHDFSCGLAPVLLNGKWGYIGHDGRFVITPQYVEAGCFREGFACVELFDARSLYLDTITRDSLLPFMSKEPYWKDEDGQLCHRAEFVLINRTGAVAFDYALSRMDHFSEGLLSIDVHGLWGFIDRGGRFQIEPQFSDAQGFSESCAAVKKDDRWFYIDTKGQRAFAGEFDCAWPFREGLACVRCGKEWAFVDKKGNLTGTPRGTRIISDGFSEGKAMFELDGRAGFLDTTGHVVIEPVFNLASGFTEGLCVVEMDGEEWSFIDHEGRRVFATGYQYVDDLHCGLAGMCINDQWGFIDRTGRTVIEPQFNSVGQFSEGFAVVSVKA